MTFSRELIVDAVYFREVSNVPTEKMLPYVLSMPRRCPCGDTWIITLSESMPLEVELGSAGQDHLALLEQALKKNCSNHKEETHLRTDGKQVWAVTQDETILPVPTSSLSSIDARG
jgi:hypothetical protein